MATFNLNIESDSVEELMDVLQRLRVQQGVAAVAVVADEAPAEEPVKSSPKAEKRGRPAKKAEAEAPAPKVEEAVQPEPAGEDLSDFLNDEPKITKQEMLDKLMAYGKAIGEKGRSEIEALLKSFGAAKFSELDEAKYAEVAGKVDAFLSTGK